MMGAADTRTVHTDALETLGSIIGEGEARDAIHLAVEPVVAAERLLPGQDVGLLRDGTATAKTAKPLGIVDPFIKGVVNAGERFWLVVYPRQITSLRHVWMHPDFPATPDLPSQIGGSEHWLREYAASIDTGYNALIEAAKEWVQYGEWFVESGKFEGVGTDPAFWGHFENVTGIKVEDEKRHNFFSCSC